MRYVAMPADEARALIAASQATDDDFWWCGQQAENVLMDAERQRIEVEEIARSLNAGRGYSSATAAEWRWGEPSMASLWTVRDTKPPAPSDRVSTALVDDGEDDKRQQRVADMLARGSRRPGPFTPLERIAIAAEENALHLEAIAIKLDAIAIHLGATAALTAQVTPAAARLLHLLVDAWETTAGKRSSMWRGVVAAVAKYAPDPEAKRKR